MRAAGVARAGALIGYVGLVSALVAWNAWLRPNHIVLTLLLIPLVFPLPGILRGRPYTYAWSSFLALAYFVLGVWHAAIEAERSYGLSIVAASLFLFGSCLAYVRFSRVNAAG